MGQPEGSNATIGGFREDLRNKKRVPVKAPPSLKSVCDLRSVIGTDEVRIDFAIGDLAARDLVSDDL